MLKQCISKEKIVSAVFYGTGILSHMLTLAAKVAGLNIICYADSNAAKWGEMFEEKRIIAPTELSGEDNIIIASTQSIAIKIFLNNIGFKNEKIIVLPV